MADADRGGRGSLTETPEPETPEPGATARPEDLRGLVGDEVHRRGGPAVWAAARAVDEWAPERCLVHGSALDDARDLDLLVSPATEAVLDDAFARAGCDRLGEDWLVIDGSAAAAVSLSATPEWGLDAPQIDLLFATARPIAGTSKLVRPSPPHELLVLARRLAVHPGRLGTRHRDRVAEAERDAPDAWSRARAEAPTWGCPHSLEILAEACARDGVVRRREALRARIERRRHDGAGWLRAALGSAASLVPRPIRRIRARRARGAVVALSGIDGSGKSTQAELLAEALWSLGYDPVVEWSRITFEASLDRIARPVKAVLALASRRRANDPGPAAPDDADPVGGHARALRQRSRLVGGLWAGIVAAVHAWALRRATLRHLRAGRIVVRDRYLLDSVVQLEWAYADGRDLGWQTRIIRLLVPRAAAAFFLDLDPERAHGRKPEEFDVEQLRSHRETYARHTDALDITVVDAARAAPEVFATLLHGTLPRLGPPAG